MTDILLTAYTTHMGVHVIVDNQIYNCFHRYILIFYSNNSYITVACLYVKNTPDYSHISGKTNFSIFQKGFRFISFHFKATLPPK